jgi:MazG family protein
MTDNAKIDPLAQAMHDLTALMARLRSPDNGCPWDIEQDFKSIAPHTIEEAYEVSDAIERGDMNDLKDELGDLLFQVVFHAQMAEEKGLFSFADVAAQVTQKMIARHPHVFGNETASKASDVIDLWEKNKDKEKKAAGNASILDDVTRALPALMRAQKLQRRVARVGFEWSDAFGAYGKLQEEMAELLEGMKANDTANIHEELGDVMFCVVNVGRMLGVDCETSLRDCNAKFERRFKGVEDDIKAQSLTLESATLDQMDAAWERQKVKERQRA